jgi:hypothetical protein
MSLLQEMEKFGLADCAFNQNLNAVVVYHAKMPDGWREIWRAPIDSTHWNKQDRWAINHLLEHGEQVLTMGADMWEIQHPVRC